MRCEICLSNSNLDPAQASDRLCFDPQPAIRTEDEQAPLAPRMLHCDSHELLNQPGQDHLARKCLRGFDYGLDVQLSHLHVNCGCGSGRSFLSQAREALLKLL